MNRSIHHRAANRKYLLDLYGQLASHHRFSHGWPGGDWPVTGRFDPPRFEVVLGAVLTQNTRWENVETALGAMADSDLTSAGKILSVRPAEVESSVRSSGFFRQKASVLINLCRLWESTGGIPPGDIIRDQLLAIPRIGPETADTLLLYALDRPEFIADTYTRRLVFRTGCFSAQPDYDSCKAFFQAALPADVDLYRKFHALIVLHARKYCRKNPECDNCPLFRSGTCRYPDSL